LVWPRGTAHFQQYTFDTNLQSFPFPKPHRRWKHTIHNSKPLQIKYYNLLFSRSVLYLWDLSSKSARPKVNSQKATPLKEIQLEFNKKSHMIVQELKLSGSVDQLTSSLWCKSYCLLLCRKFSFRPRDETAHLWMKCR